MVHFYSLRIWQSTFQNLRIIHIGTLSYPNSNIVHLYFSMWVLEYLLSILAVTPIFISTKQISEITTNFMMSSNDVVKDLSNQNNKKSYLVCENFALQQWYLGDGSSLCGYQYVPRTFILISKKITLIHQALVYSGRLSRPF